MFYLPKSAGRKHTDVTYDVGSVHSLHHICTFLSIDFQKMLALAQMHLRIIIGHFHDVSLQAAFTTSQASPNLVRDVTRQRRTERETQIWHLHQPCLHFPIFSICCRAQEVIPT